ncbi:PilW family protein [Pseudomonas petrae]|uniref:Prepilin-type N-terminal cleavage/methylation domain-containing protein n=1 Tax=Pseudomonas petrae TaxID=2912190 RepID=A0ABS9IDH9_9PSED|nr:prepilin-type N-terminal cleavage/methylation domain-containing protein [Pseudomonas petrae]MCF7531955.1 prepilin-type N-terminal cleavage/methylation domain-containing protein [Pseudomonas petrae]MCF7537518.1 prepilin-type N-terminal cleavage/methylation domain-containing protein [Pseudomonas petrae]MCF7545710.1 prepilin-type N-terminal cleavage/methylation domain-containing protein [Pseudomonas petrae]MCF7556725.1 prepilin-type N-terminal cleavage/methylation domain-containing protein [Pse
MMHRAKGFGLIEIMISLLLGLLIVAGVIQIFISAKNTYLSQNASAVMQEDARFILTKMAQEIRMVGMFGCLATITDASAKSDFNAAQVTPIQWDNATTKLTLVTADVGNNGGVPTWTVTSDCKSGATARSGTAVPAANELAFPIRQLVYQFANKQILLGGAAIVNNVNKFTVVFGTANTASDTVITGYTATPANTNLVRSVRLTLEMTDATGRVKNQTFSVLTALRNRLY